jgi:hypothetical protein
VGKPVARPHAGNAVARRDRSDYKALDRGYVALYGPGPWIKMQHTHVCPDGRKVVIHYFTNGRGLNVELKFK